MTVAADLAAALDPVVFVRQAGFEPDGWQERALRSTSPRLLINVSRQGGKSSGSGALAGWTALYEPRSLSLLL